MSNGAIAHTLSQRENGVNAPATSYFEFQCYYRPFISLNHYKSTWLYMIPRYVHPTRFNEWILHLSSFLCGSYLQNFKCNEGN